MKENNLTEIQEMVMDEMKRLSDNEYMKDNKDEIARANSLSQNATVYIKTINIQLRIQEMQKEYGKNIIKNEK